MGNGEKNTFVRAQITDAMLRMMEREAIADIRVSDLCREAGVGRASFYRNFETKEAVVSEYAAALIRQWGQSFENDPNAGLYNVFGSLFAHYKEYKDFYTLLRRQNLSDLLLEPIKEKIGLLPELSNRDAYQKAFFAYGLYGWILEWMDRGMAESPEDINRMLFQGGTNVPAQAGGGGFVSNGMIK